MINRGMIRYGCAEPYRRKPFFPSEGSKNRLFGDFTDINQRRENARFLTNGLNLFLPKTNAPGKIAYIS